MIDVAASSLEIAVEKVNAASSRADFRVTSHVLDITDEAAVERTFDSIHQRFGRIDYAVNNAGVCKGDEGGVAEATTGTFRKMIGVNLGKSLSCREIGGTVHPRMKAFNQFIIRPNHAHRQLSMYPLSTREEQKERSSVSGQK